MLTYKFSFLLFLLFQNSSFRFFIVVKHRNEMPLLVFFILLCSSNRTLCSFCCCFVSIYIYVSYYSNLLLFYSILIKYFAVAVNLSISLYIFISFVFTPVWNCWNLKLNIFISLKKTSLLNFVYLSNAFI